ncbi:MAG: DUF805 domain-containing protein, partial [Spirochaetaceae bacterium]|nr:DUF805 domain-containing protein [Spirochaetaceae bacterium]
MFCAKCGENLDNGTKFCSKCGARIDEASVQPAYQNMQQVTIPPVQAHQMPPTQTKNGWQYFVSALEKYCVFSGRARRAEYWWYALFSGLLSLFLAIIVKNVDWYSLSEQNPDIWATRIFLDLFVSFVF